jgi:hypothetical protein
MKLPILLGALALLCGALGSIIPANSTGNASWPYQTFKTVNFTPPYLAATHHTDPSEDYIFIAPDGASEYQLGPVILDVYGNLVWNGPKSHAFNFGVQEYQGEQVLVYWNGTAFPEPIGRGNGAVYLLNKHYEQIAMVTLPGNFKEQVVNASFPSNIDLHELFITKNGSVLVTANNVTNADLSLWGGSPDGKKRSPAHVIV